MGPNDQSQPTLWNFNPLADTSSVINYDSTVPYDDDTQPYDGFATPTSLTSWKNPTGWNNTLLPGSNQVYYGGPTTVPLNAGPTVWYANATPSNEAGIYDPLNPVNNAYANLYTYDGIQSGTPITYGDSSINYGSSYTYGGLPVTPMEYDSSTTQYDGMVDGSSFYFFNIPTGWTPVAGGPS